MKSRKTSIMFLVICAVLLAAALIYVFVGARANGPELDYYEFTVPVTYEEKGVVKTEKLTYCASYLKSEKRWTMHYESSGMPDVAPMQDYPDGSWSFVLELEPGYLLGDPAYADYYADGLPQPTILYSDSEGNEYSGVTEAEPFGIKLLGCEYPEPIAVQYEDKGIRMDLTTAAVLTAMSVVILLAAMVLIRKDEDVVFKNRDKESRIFNVILTVVGVPLLLVIGPQWELLPDEGLLPVLSALMAPITVLSVCASMILRRKGKSLLGFVVQFASPLLFLYLIFSNVLIGFGYYSLFIPAGILAGVLLAFFSKNGDPVYTKLDRITVATNVLLIPVYIFLCIPTLLGASILSTPFDAGTLQKILAEIFAIVLSLAPVFCGISLGLSVALRKKGKSTASFLVQFTGFGGVAFCLIVALLVDLLPWISITIN